MRWYFRHADLHCGQYRQYFYFRRIAPSRYNLVPNLLIPFVGAISTLYVMYQAFFVALWGSGFETGRSVVYFCVILFVLLVALVPFVGHHWPARLRGAAPVEAEDISDEP